MNKKNLWQAVLAELQLTLSRANFSAWFNNTKIIKIKNISKKRQLIEIAVANLYVKNTIESRYQGQIKEILDRLTKINNEIKIIVKLEELKTTLEDAGPLFKVNFEKEKKIALKKAIISCHLKPDFTFENFAVSSTNEMAHAAASAVAKNPGKTYHLLFFYGGVGVGKTHLTQAIGHKILEENPDAKIIYCTSEEFTNDIVKAIRSKSTERFRQKYRSVKALLIDDIQFIAGKEAVQEEFFHTFNAIHSEGGQIVLTSDQMPHEIKALKDRLRSRFEGGLTIDVQEPSFELRTAILLIKSKQRGITLPMDAAQLIADNIKSTRRLEGFLTQLVSHYNLKNEPITPDLCQSLLKKPSLETTKIKQTIKPEEILKIVAHYFNLKISQIKGSKRDRPIVIPRQIAMYLIKTGIKDTPYMEIGRLFGNRDHTTVMYAVNKIAKLLLTSEDLRLKVASIKKEFYI